VAKLAPERDLASD